MAIIICPECNEKISNTTSQCVHCGIAICVCPECGKIHTNYPDVCSECGYVLKKKEEKKDTYKEKKQASENAFEVKRKWKIENPFVSVADNLDVVFSIAFTIFLIIAVVKLFNWNENLSDIAVAFKTDEIRKSINTLLIFSAIFIIAEQIFDDFWETVKCTIFSNWARMKKIDLIEVVKTTFLNKDQKMEPKERENIIQDLKFTLNTAFLNNNILIKNKRITDHVINAITVTVGYIFVYSFILENVEIFMREQFLKSDLLNNDGWAVSMIDSWWKVGVGIGAIVAIKLYNKLSISKIRNERKEWVHKTMPEHKGRYKNLCEVSQF